MIIRAIEAHTARALSPITELTTPASLFTITLPVVGPDYASEYEFGPPSPITDGRRSLRSISSSETIADTPSAEPTHTSHDISKGPSSFPRLPERPLPFQLGRPIAPVASRESAEGGSIPFPDIFGPTHEHREALSIDRSDIAYESGIAGIGAGGMGGRSGPPRSRPNSYHASRPNTHTGPLIDEGHERVRKLKFSGRRC